VGLVVVALFSPLIYTLGRRLSAKLHWSQRVAAYFGVAVVAATVTVLVGAPIAPIFSGGAVDWDPHAFFAEPSNTVIAGAMILIAGLSAAGACATLWHSSIRAASK
jgi:hypothetical protein